MIHCVVAAGCKFRVAEPYFLVLISQPTGDLRQRFPLSFFVRVIFAHAVYPAYLSVSPYHMDVRKKIVSHFENWKLFAKVDATGALLKRNNKCFVKKLLSL